MPLRAPPNEVYEAYQALDLPDPLTNIEEYQTNATLNATLQAFVGEWMTMPGTDLANVSGLVPDAPPAWFADIRDADFRRWAESLYADWNMLTRQVAPNVSEDVELYTMLPVPNPFVVPGARFREVYYWDSFFVIQGLLASNLTELATSILDNFAYLIETYGHIPNGIRTYYINRSQPPLFSEMVRVVWEATLDTSVLENALPALLAEHDYWTRPPKQVRVQAPDGSVHELTRYYADWDSPRPESFREDQETARQAGYDVSNPDAGARQLWRDLASGAESGWDYSTRWFAENSTDLTTIRTTRVVPIDLNAFLFQMETNIAQFASVLGCMEVAARFRDLAARRRTAIDALAWDEEAGQWFDLVMDPAGGDGLAAPATLVPHRATFPSNWFPLAAGLVAPNSTQAAAAVESFMESGLIEEGGVPASLVESGQQWDYPNVSWGVFFLRGGENLEEG